MPNDDPLAAFGDDSVAAASFGNLSADNLATADGDPPDDRLAMVLDIPVRVTAELGETSITIKDLLSFGPGSVIELQRLAGEPANLLVNGVLIGRGDVVVVNENYGLRLTELIRPEDRIKQLAG